MACILGVLGARNTLTKQIIQDEILNPILDDLAVKPSRVLIPSEPMSSTYIECWATRNGITVDSVKSDWVKNGRRAGIIRDAYIEKEATALLIFEGPKSRYFLDLAERIAKRRPEMKVYVVESKGVSPTLLEVEAAARFNIKEDDEAAILTLPKMWASSAKSVTCLIKDD
jgi:hypothetical protein